MCRDMAVQNRVAASEKRWMQHSGGVDGTWCLSSCPPWERELVCLAYGSNPSPHSWCPTQRMRMGELG